MNISVFGLGYVGTTTAACLASEGHQVKGVDVNQCKVDQLNDGQSPIQEEGLSTLVKEGNKTGKLTATSNAKEAIAESEMAFVCVGTPSKYSGKLSLDSIRTVAEQIGVGIENRERPMTVVVRSTVLPGTVRSEIVPRIQAGLGDDIERGCNVLYHPEFLREGSSVTDFFHPPQIIIGADSEESASPLTDFYRDWDVPTTQTSIEVAEAVKYACNAFHAVKITFANEIGQFCREHEIDGREVMDLVCKDTKLNISSRYLRPGFAFGGSCLPKDLKALLSAAAQSNLPLPLLDATLQSNSGLVDRVVEEILQENPDSVGLLGLAFKPGTDDLRESPLVQLAERIIGKGKELRIHDRMVWKSRLVGENKAFVDQHLPHLSELLVEDPDDLLDMDLLVIGHPSIDCEEVGRWLEAGRVVVDLAGVCDGETESDYYIGVGW